MNDRKDNLPVTKDENIPPGSEKRKAPLFVLLIPAVICIVLLLMAGGFYMGLFVVRDRLSIVRFVPLLIFTFAFGLKLLLCVISENKFIRSIPLCIALVLCLALGIFAAFFGYEAIVGSLVYGSWVCISFPAIAAGSMVYKYMHNISLPEDTVKRNQKTARTMSVSCIVFVLFTLFGYSSGLFLRIVPSCGVESHSVAVLGSRVYYYEDGYLYIYDLTAREKEYAYTKDGEPFENSLGLFVTGAHDGVYHVSYSNTKMIFEFEGTVGDEEKLGIVDITGNKVYWKVISHSDDRFTQKIYSGEYHEPLEELLCEIPDNITLIHTYTEEAVTPSTVKDDRLYYFSSDNSGSIKCVDILSGEESTLISGEGSEYTIEKAYFYDDMILLITPEGIYSLSYDGNTRLVTELKPVTSAFDRVDDKIYFVDENDCIVSVSIEMADFSDRTYERLSGINGLGHNVSELVITGDGFVFTDPSEGPGGGLYFYNRRHEKLIKISR